jgi:hypothetical protein
VVWCRSQQTDNNALHARLAPTVHKDLDLVELFKGHVKLGELVLCVALERFLWVLACLERSSVRLGKDDLVERRRAEPVIVGSAACCISRLSPHLELDRGGAVGLVRKDQENRPRVALVVGKLERDGLVDRVAERLDAVARRQDVASKDYDLRRWLHIGSQLF